MESGSRLFRKKRELLKARYGVDRLESQLPSCKSMTIQGFVDYLIIRTRLQPMLQTFYDLPQHKQWRWKTFMNTQRSEQDFVNKMKETYGQTFVVVMGDWSDAGRTPRFQESTKTKGFRKMFSRQHVSSIPLFLYSSSILLYYIFLYYSLLFHLPNLASLLPHAHSPLISSSSDPMLSY